VLGEPDIKFAGFSLWILRREFPDREDYWDGNWLRIRAIAEGRGASVDVSGPWLRTDELSRFYDELVVLGRDLLGTAELVSIEPVLRLKAACGRLGHIDVTVELTPDPLTQSHRFSFGIDQSHLPRVLAGCKQLLDRFPIKGAL
jgi:hypothetical protein